MGSSAAHCGLSWLPGSGVGGRKGQAELTVCRLFLTFTLEAALASGPCRGQTLKAHSWVCPGLGAGEGA